MTDRELDAKVADALGVDYKTARTGDSITIHSAPDYSTNWNHAMNAAGQVGLFDTHMLRKGHNEKEWWVVKMMSAPDEVPEDGILASDDSGPKAICLAILKLKETT